MPEHGWNRRLARLLAGPPHPVARSLREGDQVGPFVVLETPGISPGHISLWREADRVLIAGDVAVNQHPVLGRPGLHEPPPRFVTDPALNVQSLQRLAGLRPEIVAFGHGPLLRGPDALVEFASRRLSSG
jgi:glyoxylase-like metal-dependent hydrolase (beta-lactamase superfamily II)